MRMHMLMLVCMLCVYVYVDGCVNVVVYGNAYANVDAVAGVYVDVGVD